MNPPKPRGACWFVWALVIALAIAHQDLWFWSDRTLALGFIPVGLLYHVGFSLACGGVWALAVRFAWPRHIEEWADEFDGPDSAEAGS